MPPSGARRVPISFKQADFTAVHKLIRELWLIRDKLARHQVRAYRDHIRECRKINDDTSIASEKVSDILDLCDVVNNDISLSVNETFDRVRSRYEATSLRKIEDQSIRQAIAFAVQLCYFVPLDLRKSSTQSIKDLTQQCIATLPYAGLDQALSDDFCEKNLTRKTSIRIRYTSNLTQHLELHGNRLYVFRHGTALREYAQNCRIRDIYPPGFLSETQATIDLLFPVIKPRQISRRRRLSKKHSADLEVGCVGTDDGEPDRDLSNYPYWGQRLAAIDAEYRSSKPGRLKQWYFDRRDATSFTMFWFTLVAFVLALIFGLVSTITGIMQTWKAFHP